MIIGIDIGNTTVEIGTVENLSNIKTFKFKTDIEKTPDDWLINLDFIKKHIKKKLEKVLISSVVPQIENKIVDAIIKSFSIKPLVIGKDIKLPIKINYDNPSEVGTDRVLNAFASLKVVEPPILVIDFGTAITFDIVNKNGEYEGGLIFPGIESSLSCLFSKTAKLPKVDFGKPNSVVGKNTVNSIKSGLYYGYVSLVEGVKDRLEKEFNQSFKVIITGGHGRLISENLSFKHILEPFLPMKGFYYLCI